MVDREKSEVHCGYLDKIKEVKPMKTRRTKILNLVEDMVSDLLYYNRKEDDDLPIGSIEEAIKNEEVSTEDIVKLFEFHLNKNIT